MQSFLLELGTEELPADFCRLVLPQFKKIVSDDLSKYSIDYGEIDVTTTPRRIVLHINSLALSAKDSITEYKGPPLDQAFKDDKPTKAAFGFARRFDLEPNQLKIKETPKGAFVFAKVVETGASSQDLLVELIPLWITALQGRRFMRWGKGNIRFSRPIRWIVALLDDQIIPIELNEADPKIISGNITQGSRLYSQSQIVESSQGYFSLISGLGVIVDRDKRKSMIEKLVKEESSNTNSIPDLSQELLDEITDLVESPKVIVGDFDENFLDLPSEVLKTVMRVHQRYIPLILNKSENDSLAINSRGQLLPKFVCIANGVTSSKDLVRAGNERVLKARLSDAEFFVKSDLMIKSSERRSKLSSVGFADNLGSLLDRVERLEYIADLVLNQLVGINVDPEQLRTASHYSKNDLVTNIVGEFPELQGVMGGKYLLKEGETREVALAVAEHYLPRFAGDNLPSSDMGKILSLSDKIDTLTSIYSKGERPSGSSDPYALRRASNGILQIILSSNWKLDLSSLISMALDNLNNSFPELDINQISIENELYDFFRLRLNNILQESGIDPDLVMAVTGPNIPINKILLDPNDVMERGQLLQEMRSTNDLPLIHSVVTRASRLADKGELSDEIVDPTNLVDTDLFESTSEFDMLNVLLELTPIVKSNSDINYKELIKGLIESCSTLSSFFDGENSVLVMSDNPKLRSNRLNLLGILRNQAKVLADFEEIKI